MKVLLVDDHAICNLISQRTLERLGIAQEIHTALNGAEAINLFNKYFQGSQSLPDVILLDLNMPVMDGFEFLEAFKKLPLPNKEKLQIIIVTSSVNEEDMHKARRLGVTQYLNKPVSPDQLKKALYSNQEN